MQKGRKMNVYQANEINSNPMHPKIKVYLFINNYIKRVKR
jgi:hypothetical protein